MGHRIRISRIKALFEKGYLPNWFEELSVVDEVKKSNPYSYTAKDINGELVLDSFYTEELQ